MKDGHQSRKSKGNDFAVLWDCEKIRGGWEVSPEATVFSLFLMGFANEKIPQCGSLARNRTGGEGSFARALSAAGRHADQLPTGGLTGFIALAVHLSPK